MGKFRNFLFRQLMRFRFISIKTSKKALYSNDKSIVYRLFDKHDSIDELTKLINEAYKVNAERGLNFLGARQDSKTTYRRIRKGICIIAIENNNIIGTITFKAPHKSRGSKWFNKSYVAKRNLLAVSPEKQKKGIAAHLIKLTELIAKNHGAEEIAFDTAEGHKTLLNFYKKNNYRYIETVKWKDTNYNSVVYSKNLS